MLEAARAEIACELGDVDEYRDLLQRAARTGAGAPAPGRSQIAQA